MQTNTPSLWTSVDYMRNQNRRNSLLYMHAALMLYKETFKATWQSTLAKCCIDSALVLECVNLLQHLAAQCNIKLIWLPAHAGIYGNEVVDKLADHAAKRPIMGPEPITAIDYELIRTANEKWLEKQLAQMWNNEQGCTHTKCFVTTANPSISKQILNMTKQDTRIITGLLTGHCKMNQHLARLRLRDDPDCDLCGTAHETARHIVCECSGTSSTRQSMYGKTTMLPEDICKFPLLKLSAFFKKCCESNIRLSHIF